MSEELVIPDLESSPGIIEKRLPRQIERAIHNAMFIAQHIDNKDDFESKDQILKGFMTIGFTLYVLEASVLPRIAA
ncbi:uncharacterized protein CEXT_266951 [Caerostris extrusa]|uniref:Uncharacterized protein n=1 Tax=Caerostris extrusa TaxID=172846 RepID=A0AAV4SFA0_CAEEX|nr:uncharacterized protein CEXT_266951 [Caerostris extrusa]